MYIYTKFMGVILYWRVVPTTKNIAKIESSMDQLTQMIRAKLSSKHVNFDDLHNGVFSIMYKHSDTLIDRRRFYKDVIVKGLRFHKPNLQHPKKHRDYLVTPL